MGNIIDAAADGDDDDDDDDDLFCILNRLPLCPGVSVVVSRDLPAGQLVPSWEKKWAGPCSVRRTASTNKPRGVGTPHVAQHLPVGRPSSQQS